MNTAPEPNFLSVIGDIYVSGNHRSLRRGHGHRVVAFKRAALDIDCGGVEFRMHAVRKLDGERLVDIEIFGRPVVERARGIRLTELVENDRIVGGLTKAATTAASALYGTFVRGKIVPTDARTAEMVKLTENAYRDVNIAFANELSMVCDGLDIDPWEVIDLANHHPRVNILQPGPGVGGHCIAVDPWFIVHAAGETAPLMRTAREVNDRKPDFVVDKIMAIASPGDRIACLGLAYKADTDDLRESPAIEIVEALCRKHDGEVMLVEPNIAQLPPRLSLPKAKLVAMDEAVNDADVLALLVDHREFKAIAPEVMRLKKTIDTRGLWRSYSRQRRAND